jgi:DNA (cytosine-5)-methyltransferase 1
MMLTVGSTFTGVGGADLGLKRAGFSVAWQCELDEWKRSVLAAHWPNVPIYDDITTLYDPTPVDLLIGGFPCQDLSVAGKRKGFNGERSVLAFEFLRLAESLRPRWLLLENVPGLLSSNGGRDLARLLDEVGTIGYGWAYRILDARYFGVPQRRRRVFICARRADAEFDSGVAAGRALRALWEGGGGDPTPGWPPRQDTTADAGSGPEERGIFNAAAAFRGWSEDVTAGTLSQRDYKSSNHLLAEPVLSFRKSKRAQTDQDDETWVEADETNTLNRFDTGDTRATQAIIDPQTMVRRLTPVECERLMGWPDGWTAPDGVRAPDSKRYAACGDGIVSWLAYWIGQRIRMIEEEEA